MALYAQKRESSRGFTILAAAGLLAAVVLALGASASRWQTAQAITNCSTSSAGLDGEETSVAQAINAQRAANGLPALKVAPSLNRAAAWKSADSSNQLGGAFSHTDSLGRSPSTRAGDCGYPAGAAENIAAGYSAATVVQAWMASPGHRNNILSSYYTVIGVGRTGNAWVTDFGMVVESGSYDVGAGSQPPPPPQSTPPPSTGGGGNPNPNPNPNPGGNSGGSEAPAAGGSTGVGGAPSAQRTALPAQQWEAWELPSNAPVRRAMIQMVAVE